MSAQRSHIFIFIRNADKMCRHLFCWNPIGRAFSFSHFSVSFDAILRNLQLKDCRNQRTVDWFLDIHLSSLSIIQIIIIIIFTIINIITVVDWFSEIKLSSLPHLHHHNHHHDYRWLIPGHSNVIIIIITDLQALYILLKGYIA